LFFVPGVEADFQMDAIQREKRRINSAAGATDTKQRNAHMVRRTDRTNAG
jgi:hypothetical protein